MTNNYNIGDKLKLFLINPCISAISAFKNIRDGVSHKFLYLWFMMFGIGFCAMNEAVDSSRYVDDFMVEHNYSWNQYMDIVREWLTFESDIKDVYTLTVNVLVGRFSDNYHWTYLIYALVFGFFYIKSLCIFLKNERVSNNFVFYSLLFIFCFSNPIFNINGVRFWTAAWIGVYVALNLFVEKDYKKLPLLILLPFIHGSSVIWIVIMGIAFLLSRFQNITIILYIASAFISAVSFLDVLSDYSYIFPQFMQNQIWSYTESDSALRKMAKGGQFGVAYADFLISLPRYFQIMLSLLLIRNRKEINKDKHTGHLMSIVLALAAVTNFLSGIPSMGRFQYFVIPLMVIVWAKNYKILCKYDKYFYAVPISYAYSLLYWYRYMSSVTEICLYLFPAPLTIIKYLFL